MQLSLDLVIDELRIWSFKLCLECDYPSFSSTCHTILIFILLLFSLIFLLLKPNLLPGTKWKSRNEHLILEHEMVSTNHWNKDRNLDHSTTLKSIPLPQKSYFSLLPNIQALTEKQLPKPSFLLPYKSMPQLK